MIFFARIVIYHNADSGQQKIIWVFGWNIALLWGRKWALKQKNSRKTSLFFSSLAKSAMNGCLVAAFFFLIDIGFICKKNFGKTFQRLLGRIPRHFCDQLKFSTTHVFTHLLEFLKICPKMFPFFYAKMIDLCLLTQKMDEYCTVAKSVGRCRTIWKFVIVRARVRVTWVLRPVRSVPVAIFLISRCTGRRENDRFLTSFRATLSLSHRAPYSFTEFLLGGGGGGFWCFLTRSNDLLAAVQYKQFYVEYKTNKDCLCSIHFTFHFTKTTAFLQLRFFSGTCNVVETAKGP